MPYEDSKVLKYNHREKSLKALFCISFDTESLLLKMPSCQNNLKKSYTEKKSNHKPSSYSWFTCGSFDASKNKLGYYRGEDRMKKLCEDFRDQVMKIINYEKKEMIPRTDEETEFYEKQKVCHICQKEFSTNKNDKNKFKLYRKVKDHCHYTGKFRGAAHSICNLIYKTPKEIPVAIHNGSTYDYHFIIKHLAKEFECDFIGLKNNKLHCKYKYAKKRWLKPVKELIKKFAGVYQFCNGGINKFVLLLKKVVYPYEYMNSWERFNETSLPDKEAFGSELNLEDITDEDYAHGQKVWEVFEIKNLGEYHNLNVQSNTLLLADVFENFRGKCTEIYELDPAHFLSAHFFAWQACLKNSDVELELLTDIDMLLMVEKGIRGGMCQTIHTHAKADNKYMKNYDKDIQSTYLMFLDANNLYGWTMSQKFPVNGFEWVEDISQFNEDFIKNYGENSERGYFLEVDVEYPKNLHNLHSNFPFLPERKKIKRCSKLACGIQDKEKYVVHIRALKQALNHGFILKTVHRVIQFNQEACLKPYIDMNTQRGKEEKNQFEKDFFKLMNNAVFGKTMKNVRKQRDIKLVKTDKRSNQLASEPNYHTTKYFSENLLAIGMKKIKVKMN